MAPLILSLSKDTPILTFPCCGVGAGLKPAPTVAHRHPHPNLPPLILSLSKDAGRGWLFPRHHSGVANEVNGFPHVGNQVVFRLQDAVIESSAVQKGLANGIVLAQRLQRRVLPA